MNKDGQLGVLGVFIKPDHSGHENEALAKQYEKWELAT